MPTVSVIMSVFNTNLIHLKASIDSIINQTFTNWQFIIVDDGNKSIESKEYLKNIADSDSRIKLIVNNINLGLTQSLNIGLKYCTGKYIARMDSDDISLPDRLFKQLCYMESHTDIDVLGCNVNQFGDPNIRIPKFKNHMKNRRAFYVKMLFNNVGPIHPTVMIRRSFIEKNSIKYREDIKKAQDYAFWIDCLNAGAGFACLNEQLLLYRIHRSQITILSAKEQNTCKQKIIRENLRREFSISNKESKIFATLYSETFEYRPKEYVESIKNLIACADEDIKELLKNELQERWLHKVAKCMVMTHDFRGMKQLYTYQCLFSKNMFRWIKSVIK